MNHESPQWFISSRDFVFCFYEMSHTNRDVFLTYKSMIIPLIMGLPNVYVDRARTIGEQEGGA